MGLESNHAFHTLQIIGGVSFILVVTSAFIIQRRGQSRNPAWFSFCISWIVYCFSYALLGITGRQAHPSHGLCLAQSALVNAATLLVSSAAIGICTHFMLDVIAALSISSLIKKRSSRVAVLFLLLPWFIWITSFSAVLILGIKSPNIVGLSPAGAFCYLKRSNIDQVIPMLAACTGGILIAEQGIVLYTLYRNRELLPASWEFIIMATRIGITTLLAAGITIVVGLQYSLAPQTAAPFEVLISIIPLLVAIILGCQKDLLHIWLFWKPHNPHEEALTLGAAPGVSAAFSTILSGDYSSICSSRNTDSTTDTSSTITG